MGSKRKQQQKERASGFGSQTPALFIGGEARTVIGGEARTDLVDEHRAQGVCDGADVAAQ